MQLPEAPAVLVLLVVTDGEVWLPNVLRGLRAQQYPTLKILAVDNASTDGSPAMLKKAFGVRRVVTLEERVGYGRALGAAIQVAAERQMEADAVVLLHDDAALVEGSIEAMLEVLGRDEVGIVGAKLLEWDDPQVLQDIGRTTDRFGRVVARVERGEIDQGQHDGLEEVLWANSAAMMIHREVVEKVGLFDLRYEALRDDLDLCWRARLAGFRTVITTDAAAVHAAATVRDLRGAKFRRRNRYYGDRNMIATLIKNYSWPSLAFALPATFAVSLLNVVLYLVRGRRASAFQVLEALQWNITHLPSTMRARRRAQAVRTTPDRQVRKLMRSGATRVRAQVERAVELVVGEVEEVTDDDLERTPDRIIDKIRAHPGGAALVVIGIIALLGARPLLVSGPVAGLELPPFPAGPGAFFEEFASGWRGPAGGGAGPATPGFVLLGVLTFILIGSGWLAQRALLFGLPVVGAIGMVRLARALGLGSSGVRIAAALFGASPLMLSAFGMGRLPDLVLAAAAPWLVLPLARAAGLAEARGWRSTAAGTAGLAAAVSLSPWSLVFVAGATAALSGAVASSRRAIARTGGIMLGGAAILLLPWSVDLFRPGSPLGAGGGEEPATMLELLALMPGTLRPVPIVLGFGIAVAGVAGAAIMRSERSRTMLPIGAVGVVGLIAAWLVGRGVPWIAPRPTLPLIAVALAFPLFAGEGVDAAGRRLGRTTFGIRHVAAILVGILLGAQIAGIATWVSFGDRPGLVPADTLALSSLELEATEGGAFRVAWLGGTGNDPRIALTDAAGASMRGFLARRAGGGHDALRRVAASMIEGSTEAAGRLLATFGVRYVIVRPEADAAIREAVAAQPDLAFAQRLSPRDGAEPTFEDDPLATGALVYRNEAGIPVAAPIRSEGWAEASSGSIDGVMSAESRPRTGEGFLETSPGTYVGETAGDAEVVLLAEDFSPGWRARAGDEEPVPERSFGWGTRFTVPVDGPITVWFGGQRWHRAGILLQALLVAAFIIWRGQRIARDRGVS